MFRRLDVWTSSPNRSKFWNFVDDYLNGFCTQPISRNTINDMSTQYHFQMQYCKLLNGVKFCFDWECIFDSNWLCTICILIKNRTFSFKILKVEHDITVDWVKILSSKLSSETPLKFAWTFFIWICVCFGLKFARNALLGDEPA